MRNNPDDEIRDEIIRTTIRKYRIRLDDLTGKKRIDQYVRARVEVAVRLSEAGFGTHSISKALKKRYTTVYHYIRSAGPDARARKRVNVILNLVEPDVRAAVMEYSKRTGIRPMKVVVMWLSERARETREMPMK